MVTITEDYVSFEVAKLLKEKGFDEPCECAYSEGGQYLLSCYKGIADRRVKNDEALDFSYSSTAPTLQMAMKWLREVHKLHIDIDPSEGDWNPGIIELKTWSCAEKLGDNIPIQKSYEEAVEIAIKYCLKNLIKYNNSMTKNFNISIDESLVDEQVTTFCNITKEMCELYAKKNHDYGNSFDEGCDKIGTGYPLGRLLDKMNRLIACMGKEDEMQVNESIEDTLTDLACYSVMTLSYLRRKKNK